MGVQEHGFPASPVRSLYTNGRRRVPVERPVALPNYTGPLNPKPSPLPNNIPGENRMTLLPYIPKQRSLVDVATQRDQMITMLLNAYKNRLFK